MKSIKTFFRMFKQITIVLCKKDKLFFSVLIVLSFISALLETLGVGVILPLILALLQPQKLLEYSFILKVMNFFNLKGNSSLVLLVASGVIVVFILKNGFILFFGKARYRFQNHIERRLSKKMFLMYMHKDYSFFVENGVADVEKGVSSDATAVSTCVENFNALFNELLTCTMIGMALVIINPLMAITIIGMAGVISLLNIQVLRKKISQSGEKTRRAYINRSKTVIEMVEGIKEILVLNKQKFFCDRYEKQIDEACNWNTKYLALSLYPSRLTEMLFVTGLVILMVISFFSVEDTDVLVAQFSFLAVAAIRVLPSISSISNLVNSLVFHRPYLENAYEIVTSGEFNELQIENLEESTRNVEFKKSIVIKNVYWRYSEEQEYIFEGLSLEIEKGETIGIIGESGVGKTTLIDILLGLYKPKEGNIYVDGKDLFEQKAAWTKKVGYVPQNVFIFEASIRDNITFGEKFIDEDRLNLAIKSSKLKEFIDSLPEGIDSVLSERGLKISGGQKQRIAIARILYHNPEVVVFDEATSALDNETEEMVIDSINKLKGEKTIIFVTHRLSALRYCDRVYRVENKRVSQIGKEAKDL